MGSGRRCSLLLLGLLGVLVVLPAAWGEPRGERWGEPRGSGGVSSGGGVGCAGSLGLRVGVV